MELVSLDSFFWPEKGFVDGTPITKGARCVVNYQSLLDMMYIILMINHAIANTHSKSPSKKRSVVGLSGKKNGKFEEVTISGRKKLKILPVGICCYMFTT